ncbi:MAG: cytochrome C [Alphaproteobacteria bacterium]|nr:cytochrome C [Alphaproteobacteria bacterium]
MSREGLRFTALAGVILAFLGGSAMPASAADLANAGCLTCHDSNRDKIAVIGPDGKRRAVEHVDGRAFGRSIHSDLQCVACHKEIVDSQASHKKLPGVAGPNCVTCHEALWEVEKKNRRNGETQRLKLVVDNIEAYRKSFHAAPDKDRPGKPKAYCEDCHSSHRFNVPPADSPRRTAWHRSVPETCGNKCHEDQLEAYAASIHAEELTNKGNVKSAVCTDCHSAHSVVNTSTTLFKLGNVNTCGTCHEKQLRSYSDTYHGQVNRLGYAYTAKCADCHDSHGVRAVDDPKSKVHPSRRLKTCQTCHNDKKPGMHPATAGYVSFGPHAHAGDFAKYPQMWLASKFMIALLIFVFAFFWTHSGLWYYREWKDRKDGKAPPRIDTKGLAIDESKHFQRFSAGWRVAHLIFALVTMTLILTGTTALYAESAWAPWVAKAVGGPRVLGYIHRVAAFLFVGMFLIHFVYVMQKLLRDRSFRWFGSDSLIPNWKDLADCWGMFKWFVGRGPRPLFDRWTYFEKFDYWAVFWGVNIIGWSGLMLAFPHVTATYLPGWVFNVATVIHGEEAFLAAVFLFTVHFFNNHFRPDKLPPPDVVMFTGTQSLAEFRRDHPAQYQQLVDSGELAKRLVDAPSPAMHKGSVILGLALIGIGLVLLILIGIGFAGS